MSEGGFARDLDEVETVEILDLGVGFRVWGLGFRVYGLGFGV